MKKQNCIMTLWQRLGRLQWPFAFGVLIWATMVCPPAYACAHHVVHGTVAPSGTRHAVQLHERVQQGAGAVRKRGSPMVAVMVSPSRFKLASFALINSSLKCGPTARLKCSKST